jgi:phosphoglycerate dehydrogenase-like enzyme
MTTPFPAKDALRICFAHVAYALHDTLGKRGTGISSFQAWDYDSLLANAADLDVLVISGLWNNDILANTPNLRFIQSIGAGYDQFPLDELRSRGIRLANASGVNKNAVSEHTFSLILSLTRHLKSGARHQRDHFWRGMISDIPKREDELAGKTMGIVGMGAIGSRVAKIAKAFDMTVLATKRNPTTAEGPADKVVTPDRIDELLSQSDVLVLTCSLNDQTRDLINADSLSRMKPTAYLINMARGGCVDEGRT